MLRRDAEEGFEHRRATRVGAAESRRRRSLSSSPGGEAPWALCPLGSRRCGHRWVSPRDPTPGRPQTAERSGQRGLLGVGQRGLLGPGQRGLLGVGQRGLLGPGQRGLLGPPGALVPWSARGLQAVCPPGVSGLRSCWNIGVALDFRRPRRAALQETSRSARPVVLRRPSSGEQSSPLKVVEKRAV